MRVAEILNKEGGRDKVFAYSVDEFPIHLLNPNADRTKHRGGKKVKYYCHEFMTFDIESTTVLPSNDSEKPWGFMYHWQACIGGIVVYGRTWEEVHDLFELLIDYFQTDAERHFVCYIHNAGFELQFMRDFLIKWYGALDLFAAKPQKPLRFSIDDGLEFRDSYLLSNMSLNMFTKEEDVEHPKANGDLDYKKFRLPSTPLDDTEFGYCISDVVSLYEAIEKRMLGETDSLESIPMTSTGYVRRACRKACRKDRKWRENVFLQQKMNSNVYNMLKEESRGGNTHANRYRAGRTIKNVKSFDAVSEYPAMMLLGLYPCDKYTPYGDIESWEEYVTLSKDNALLFHAAFEGLRCKVDTPIPYIPSYKCKYLSTDAIIDNGRVLDAERAFLTLDDIDFSIIEKQYEWDSVTIGDLFYSPLAPLPKVIRDFVFEMFKGKCELKVQIKALEKAHLTDDEKEKLADLKYEYGKYKNRLNGIFGMAFTDPVHGMVVLKDSGEWETIPADVEEALEKFYRSRNSFLVYAWGVRTTSLGREHLQSLLDVTDPIYCDTDSSKTEICDFKKLDDLNRKIMERCEEMGCVYIASNGDKFYPGVFEDETPVPLEEFKTLGAKKYAYRDDEGVLHLTVSGVRKKEGAEQLEKAGGLSAFKPGFIFTHPAAGSILYYNNDKRGVHYEWIHGEKVLTASNIGMIDNTYTVGITEEYAEILGFNLLDF